MLNKHLVKICSMILIVCIIFTLTGCGSAISSSPSSSPAVNNSSPAETSKTEKKATYTLRLGHEGAGDDHPYNYGALKFAELVEAKTNGDVKIEVYGNASLGTQKEMVEMVFQGTLDFVECVSTVLESYDSRWGVAIVPYLFRDIEHCWTVYDSEVGKEMMDWTKEKGLDILAIWQNGVVSIETKKPVKLPSDVKGIKMRIQSGQVAQPLADILGVVPTNMAMSELYSGLQLNAIDGILQQIPNIYGYKFYEVAPYFCNNEFMIMVEPLVANSANLSKLPKEYQDAIKEAAMEAAVAQRDYTDKLVAEKTAECEEKGLKIYTPTEEEMNIWRKTMAPLKEMFPEWKDIIAKIESM
ncbi:MAG: TRAP transporter substrate-binding protein [Clostridiaceae bacterium]|jgi:tripartite ATP-independent transporter DctP family solute receptor|nr:TRAP transporter substrate-binding protein [Clostridiaceae bacterium]